MNLFKKLGFRKLDEKGAQKQLYIINTAAKNSYFFYTFALLSLVLVEMLYAVFFLFTSEYLHFSGILVLAPHPTDFDYPHEINRIILEET